MEAGLATLTALLAFSLALLWLGWRNRPTTSAGWTLTTTAVATLGHSLIDFNLSCLGFLLRRDTAFA